MNQFTLNNIARMKTFKLGMSWKINNRISWYIKSCREYSQFPESQCSAILTIHSIPLEMGWSECNTRVAIDAYIKLHVSISCTCIDHYSFPEACPLTITAVQRLWKFECAAGCHFCANSIRNHCSFRRFTTQGCVKGRCLQYTRFHTFIHLEHTDFVWVYIEGDQVSSPTKVWFMSFICLQKKETKEKEILDCVKCPMEVYVTVITL